MIWFKNIQILKNNHQGVRIKSKRFNISHGTQVTHYYKIHPKIMSKGLGCLERVYKRERWREIFKKSNNLLCFGRSSAAVWIESSPTTATIRPHVLGKAPTLRPPPKMMSAVVTGGVGLWGRPSSSSEHWDWRFLILENSSAWKRAGVTSATTQQVGREYREAMDSNCLQFWLVSENLKADYEEQNKPGIITMIHYHLLFPDAGFTPSSHEIHFLEKKDQR